MKIAVNGWFLGQATTGSGQYLHHLLAYLPRRFPQARLTVFVPARARNASGPGLPASIPTNPERFNLPNLEIVPLPLAPGPSSFAKLWWEQVTIPRAAHNAQVLWVPYWAAPLWQPCPTVVTVHDLIPQLLPAYRGGWLQRLYTRLVGYTARRAAAILTVSHAAAHDIAQHLSIAPERIHVVYHGPNHPETHAPTRNQLPPRRLAEVRARYALPARFFLYLGGFDVRKNVANILAAYSRYLARGGDPRIKLVIGGALPQTDTAFAPDPRRLAREQGLSTAGEDGDAGAEAQVHFCGFVEDADKAPLYALAHAFFFPSLYEGFGMMLLEAMAAGAPVVTSGPRAKDKAQ